MSPSIELDLLTQIRLGDDAAWREVIERFEGRLRAFAYRRLNDQTQAEDVVQETFIGFLTGLPNYDQTRTPLEPFLFRIAAYKITDILRKQGRRPPLQKIESSGGLPGQARQASSLARSREEGGNQRAQLVSRLSILLEQWKSEGAFERLKTCELLFVRGWPNKQVAEFLELTEQQVANHKQACLNQLKR